MPTATLDDLPVAGFALPWDDAAAPPPVEALAVARRELGDTFVLRSGGDDYLFVFSEVGLRSFYALAERDASKGLADYRMLLRKLPPELFDGRRTFAHDLFGAQEVEGYLGAFEAALDVELAALGDVGWLDAFAFGRRLGHRLGISCWIGPAAATGDDFGALVAAFDSLDGADAFVHPESMAGRGDGYTEERAALEVVSGVVGRALEAGADGFLADIAARWVGAGEPARTDGVARDVVLLHVATMTNLVAALGWTLAHSVLDADVLAAAADGDRAVVERVAIDALRRHQRSIMMRTVLRPVEIDDGDRLVAVEPGVIVATMVPVTNPVVPPEQAITFGSGPHRCPARRFSTTAVVRTILRLAAEHELRALDALPGPLPRQIGGVARPDGPFRVAHRRRMRS